MRRFSIMQLVLVVPRVLFDGWIGQDFVSLLSKTSETKALADTFIKACKTWHFQGLVLEVWSQLAGRVKNNTLQNLVQQIGNTAYHQNQFAWTPIFSSDCHERRKSRPNIGHSSKPRKRIIVWQRQLRRVVRLRDRFLAHDLRFLHSP